MSHLHQSFTSCPECGAENAPAGGRCWLCHAEVPGATTQAPPQVYDAKVLAEPHQFRTGEIVSGVALIAILVVLVLVGIGIAMEGTGMIVPYLIVVVPALVATASRGLAHRVKGKPLSWSQRLITFVVSGVATLGALALLCISLVLALFVFCLYAMSQMGYQ